uniref:Uncharacterized protein n=1 Tax=Arundo donax TaxID=35708 RepID=A0A0A9BYG7_ARUDO
MMYCGILATVTESLGSILNTSFASSGATFFRNRR